MTQQPPPFASFGRPSRALVVGASGGLGGAFAARLAEAGFETSATARDGLDLALDVTDETSIAAAFAALPETPSLRLVIVASGLLHDAAFQPEKSVRTLDATRLARSFAVNTIGPALVAKHAFPRLPREGKSVIAVLSARIGSIADNRLGGWYGYRASKAAVNQIVHTLAIEARRTHPGSIIVALHPGTVATRLSAPFRGDRDAVEPRVAVDNLLDVIDRLKPPKSGGFFAWDGAAIPY